MAKTTKICASSKVSVKKGDNYFTVEYCEERSINERDNLESERYQLWQDVNSEVDNQVIEILKMS